MKRKSLQKISVQHILFLFVIFICFSFTEDNNTAKRNNDLSVSDLKCEYFTNPIGIDVKTPQLSWRIKSDKSGTLQSAYQIIVADSPENLVQDNSTIWNSGKVLSEQSVLVTYSGKPLISHSRYYWKVRIFDQDGRESEWSEPAFWVTGLLSPDDWKAKWINWQPAPAVGTPVDPHGNVSPWMRKNFDLTAKPSKALAFVNVAGYEELYVNGKKVGDDLLTPAVSDYAARSFYVTYDITSNLQPGHNCIALWLGRGWYDPVAAYKDKTRGPGARARLQCEITVGDKQVKVLSDTTWKAAASPYTTIGSYQWNAYNGENYDANMENPLWNLASFDDSAWENVHEVNSPAPVAQAQPCPLNRIGQRFKPVAIKDLGHERYELDFGTDLTGGFKFRFPHLEKGDTITFHYADERRDTVSDKGSVPEGSREYANGSYKDLVFTGRDGKHNAYQSMHQYDVYIPSGKPGEVFQSKFNYHGFRYVIIENLPAAPTKQDAEATLIESDLESAGSFSCSNELFNRIHATNVWTLRCLNLGGYLFDCPHRERLGYGDHHVSIETNVMNLWMPAFYQKWIQDWRDIQNPNTGMVPHAAPQRTGGGGPAWSGTLQALTWRQYLYYGDKRILENNYDACRRFADALESHCKNGILRMFGTYWDFIGEWVAPHLGMDTDNYPPKSPVAAEFFNNCYRVYLWEQLGRMAAVLGRTDEAKYCKAKIDTIRPLIHAEFYDAKQQRYVRDEQTYLLMPIMTGIVPEELSVPLMNKLVNSILIKNNGHLDTGFWGTFFLLQYFQETGRNDLIYKIMNQKTYPGWGYMISQGATTFWEQWNGFYSRIHSTFTCPGGWFYQGLAGIRVDENAPGFKNIIIKPAIVGDLKWVKAKHNSSYGSIESSWEYKAGKVTMNITIPPNTTATVYIPTTDINSVKENSNNNTKITPINYSLTEEGYAVCRVGSGNYVFSSIMNK